MQVISLFKSYFTVFDEDSLRNNFVLIYELLDGARPGSVCAVSLAWTRPHATRIAEVMDDGYPQILNAEALKLYITQEGVRSEHSLNDSVLRVRFAAPRARATAGMRDTHAATRQRRAVESRNATMQVTGAVSWRREGLRYKKNEVYLDIVESINVLMTAKGTPLQPRHPRPHLHSALTFCPVRTPGAVLRSDVTGKVLMKCFLSVRAARRAWPAHSAVGTLTACTCAGHAGAEAWPERPAQRGGRGRGPAQHVVVQRGRQPR